MLDLRAMTQQHVDDGDLDAGFARRSARRDETKRRAAASINFRFGFDIRACREQQLGDPGRVRRRLLPVTLHTVRGDVVQQRAAMLARGSCPNQPRMLPQQLL